MVDAIGYIKQIGDYSGTGFERMIFFFLSYSLYFIKNSLLGGSLERGNKK